MGDQVGLVCYPDRVQAEDAYYSRVVPTVDAARLYQPERKADGWYYQTAKLQAALPQCSPGQSLKEGVELGFLVFGLLAVAWGIQFIRRVLR